ncbi:MAG: hypothetical protein FWC57_04990 [Endomicrobia bacterium]|nr:hypothetical protein [Endomicrobiia bacterium]
MAGNITISRGVGGKLSSVNKKRLCALFIFTCMLVNGFAFSTVEISRYSLFVIAVAAAQNVAVSMFSKCNSSMIGVSNKVCGYLGGILKVSWEHKSAAANKQDTGGKENSKAGAQAAIVQQTFEKKVRSVILEKNEKIAASAYSLSSVFGICDAGKKTTGAVFFVFLGFIAFIAGIRRRKIFDGAAYLNFINLWKTTISA